jgi:hypothetical protein
LWTCVGHSALIFGRKVTDPKFDTISTIKVVAMKLILGRHV